MKIETQIKIHANVYAVWNKLTDFKSYPEWNLFMNRIEGEQAIGKSLVVDINPPGGSKATFKPILTHFIPNQEMRWVGVLGTHWLFRGEHYFQLKDNGDGTTNFMHGETFTGWLVPLFRCLAGKKTLAGFNLMNENLKSVVEGQKAK